MISFSNPSSSTSHRRKSSRISNWTERTLDGPDPSMPSAMSFDSMAFSESVTGASPELAVSKSA